MTYELVFSDPARREWEKLDPTIRNQFSKVLKRRQVTPRVPAARVHGNKNLYKIKLRDAGYRLVYEVIDNRLMIFVIGIGRRNRNEVYETVKRRLDDLD